MNDVFSIQQIYADILNEDLKLGRKNVHAGIIGILSKESPRILSTPITYNPYKYKSFVKKDDETPVFKADMVSLINRSVTADGLK